MSVYLGIDTSNYTTSAAIAEDGRIILNEKSPLPVKEGERGLRQSDAVFAHIKNLPELMKRIGAHNIDAVGVSAFPRDAEGSYMPCFEAGVAAASAIASLGGKRLYKYSHQRGHIAAALYSAGCTELYRGEFLAFHVSGGTTELLRVKNGAISLVGQTLDLNAGQLIDRVGVKAGMKFPCGAQLERIALEYDGKPIKPRVCVTGLDCNLSGAENQAAKLLDEGKTAEAARYTLEYIGATLIKMTENALIRFGELPILYAGGVMSDRLIRDELESRFDAHFAEPQFSCDNAAGIAYLTFLSENAGQ